jgi:hypothetical protein
LVLIRSIAERIHGAPTPLTTLAALLALALGVGACDRRGATEPGPGTTSSSVAAPTTPTVRYVYGEWSEWQVDCSKRAADPNVPCVAVRKRICLTEGTREGISCDRCGGQCKDEVTDKSPPLYIYGAWSDWSSNCESCSAEPRPCKAERTRSCITRLAGGSTDCEFCGGACKEQEDRLSGCAPECKWTRVHAYSDSACTNEVPDDTFAGQWGPQTNSPFNAGCSETQWIDKCVKFGNAYYKWERCVRGCTPPLRK